MTMKPPDLLRGKSGASDYSFEDEFEDEDYGIDESSYGAEPVAKSRCSTQIFESLEALRREEDKRIEEVVECTGIPPDDAFVLLRRHGWDPAAFNESFFENAEESRRVAGVSDPDELTGKRQEGLCCICFTDPGVQIMPCEGRQVTRREPHPTYCRDCWLQFVQHSVREGKSCLELRCPTPGCGEAVRPGIITDLLAGRDKALLERFRRFQAESLVDDSRGRAKWCPGQGCGRAALEPPMGIREVDCPCGTMWCFGCGTDAHLPVSCEIVQRWEEKNRDEGEDATWIRVNAKLCPKCANPIEKNGGCMHMTCRKPGGCGHEFCWICMAPWSTHKNCNGEPSENDAETKAKGMAKSALLRYGHFYERYVAHHKAQIFSASTQRQKVSEMVATFCVVQKDSKVSDFQFLDKAVSEIRDCRRFLKWTYAYAYFKNFPKKQKELFEFHQGQLEDTLERLSDIMENTQWDALLDEEAESFRFFYDVRERLIGMTDVVHKFFSHLQEAIQQGTLFESR